VLIAVFVDEILAGTGLSRTAFSALEAAALAATRWHIATPCRISTS
jgi:hypothetical protein